MNFFRIVQSQLGRKMFGLVGAVVFFVLLILGVLLVGQERESLLTSRTALEKALIKETELTNNSLETLGQDNNDNLLAALQERGRALGVVMTTLGARALAENDAGALSTLLQALEQYPDVRYAEFADSSGRVMAMLGGNAGAGERVEIRLPVTNNGRVVGGLTLHLSKVQYNERVRYNQEVIDSTRAMKQSDLEHSLKEANALLSQRVWFSALSVAGMILVSMLVLSILLGVFFSKAFLEPIEHIVRVITTDTRNLTRHIDLERNDELGMLAASFNTFLADIRGIMHNTVELIDQMNAALHEIAATAEELNATSGSISDSVQSFIQDLHKQEQETTSSVQAIAQVSDNLLEITQKSEVSMQVFIETENVSRDGQKTVQESIGQFSSIAENMDLINSRIQNLLSSLVQIDSFIETINGISSQTDLLALNAAIEAARAGEAGRGFSVVAEEVRKLAENAASASNQIQSTISSLIPEMNSTGEATQAGAKSVDVGRLTIIKAGDSLEQILSRAKQASEVSSEMSRRMRDQSLTLNQMKQKIEFVHNLGQNNYTLAENIAASVQEQTASLDQITNSLTQLLDDANGVRNRVAAFKVD